MDSSGSLLIHFIKADEKEHYNINKLAPKWHFILIIIGRSGSGKTNTVVNLLKYLFFDNFYLCKRSRRTLLSVMI
jgi:type II secretory ATPase GspE/PulE/Tfp pilus assembly ATPase PilB-like protein